MKTLIRVVTAALALSACSNVTGPEEHEVAARAARAKADLESASKVSTPSLKLAAN